MPDVRLEYDWLYGTAGVALFVVGVLAATVYACAQEMRQKPASLMRPKAPRAGSRILLERIKPLWNRMSFLGKVTARNIFRFKSRLIMTVGGVAGCTALIVCGLAINDTVAALGAKQYQDVYQYDLMVSRCSRCVPVGWMVRSRCSAGSPERLPLRLRCPILENRTRMVLPARRAR